MIQHIFHRPSLNHSPGVEDDNPMADVADYGEVVGDDQIAQLGFPVQLGQHLQDPRLHRDVQCGQGLIQDQKLGFRRQRAGHTEALALTGAQFVRISG